MKKIILAAACIAFVFASCSDDKKTETNNTTNTANTQAPAPNQAPAGQQTVTTAPTTTEGGNVNVQPQQANAPQVQMQNAAPDGGQAPKSGTINPPHGQPGHTCAVPVGQPIP